MKINTAVNYALLIYLSILMPMITEGFTGPRHFVTIRVTRNPRNVLLYNLENDEEFTQKQILKEETEAPFRKVRLFILSGLGLAAGLGTFLTLTSLLASITGTREGDLNQIYQNLGVNGLGLPVIGYFIKRDLDAQKATLNRIQKGGKLAGLRLKIGSSDGPTVVKLSDLRRDRGLEKKVVIVAAPSPLLASSVASSIIESKNIASNNIIMVPLVINSDEKISGKYGGLSFANLESMVPEGYDIDSSKHFGQPVALAQWNAVLGKELEVALKQTPQALQKGVTIMIKTNGKVGSRKFGVPIWDSSSDANTGVSISTINY